jgi:hypothetical protein
MVNLRFVLLSAPASLAGIMVIGPHHAAVTHAGDSSEVGQREHIRGSARVHSQESAGLSFCVLVAISSRRAKWGVCAPRDAPGRRPSAGPPAAGAPPAGPWQWQEPNLPKLSVTKCTRT